MEPAAGQRDEAVGEHLPARRLGAAMEPAARRPDDGCW